MPAAAVGATGVPVKEGELDNTTLPVPVDVVTPVPPFVTDKVPVTFEVKSIEPASILFVTLPKPIVVALPTLVTSPVRFALVVTLPAVKFAAVPEIFVPTNVDGVPKLGVTNVGDVDNTTLPEPVDVVTPVPPFVTDKVPVILNVTLI